MENWKHLKILVVEDEMSNYMFIWALLEETGIQIAHVGNGKKAVELCANEHFDVILMDIKMPVMNGFEAVAEIRKFNKDIVIIAQTAYACVREECMAEGFTDYIAKPFKLEKLLKMLAQYINNQ